MILLATILSAYLVFLIVMVAGWYNKPRLSKSPHKKIHSPFVSVIIAARNEENNLLTILQALRNQHYENFEVILVDDHSTDSTLAVARSFAFDRLTIISSHGSGKKSALSAGIDRATGQVIVTTDADCSMGSEWLASIAENFWDQEVQLCIGGVSIKNNGSFFSKLQSIEFASLIGSTAAFANLGRPIMCNGANLSFRKSAFIEVGGYAGNLHVASGDDEFLLRKIARRYPNAVRFISSSSACVATLPHSSLTQFFHQRLRWAGKWQHNTSALTKAIAFFVLLTQLAQIVTFSFFLLAPSSIMTVLVLKILLEGYFIYTICRFTKAGWSWSAFLSLQFIYPLYVLTVGIMSNFLHPIWKGRQVQSMKVNAGGSSDR